uniref:Uncharacterized protein n=1 Tax=Utricularia reniformis TaxID=192314 RepID=A0A1Y0AZK0_9LAMI|nr:hypothetical protein AEK19_MT0283 [Utricularia reniformis]ART30559.1 hypothetical protein AEK19_MT0283 [Utricularia reniformis]
MSLLPLIDWAIEAIIESVIHAMMHKSRVFVPHLIRTHLIQPLRPYDTLYDTTNVDTTLDKQQFVHSFNKQRRKIRAFLF